MPQWLLMAAAPRWRMTTWLIRSAAIPLLLCALYFILLATNFRNAQGGFGTLAGVAQLFSNPWVLLAGWVHYLAFDLLVGSWETIQATQRGIPRVVLIPCLCLTFMLGPIGFLLFFAIRSRYPKPETASHG